MRSRIAATTTALALAVAGIGAAAAPASAQAATCSTRWGTAQKGLSMKVEKAGGAVTAQRFGHHACYDRIVLDVKGPIGSVVAGYVAKGKGGAALVVAVRHDSPKDLPVSQQLLATRMPTVMGAGVLATTTQAQIGSYLVKGRLPFRVYTLKGPGALNRVVIDVAHR